MNATAHDGLEPSGLLLQRTSGVLLHVTSLPGHYGIGDFSSARSFVDFLARAGQRWWQTLPLTPVGPNGSPYSGPSAFAGNLALIDLEALVRCGWLPRAHCPTRFASATTDLAGALRLKREALRRAWSHRDGFTAVDRDALAAYRFVASSWLADYALFVALTRRLGHARWHQWPVDLRERRPDALAQVRRELAGEIEFVEFEEFVFDRQWQAVRAYASDRGVGVIGDVPIFVAHESADVWSRQHEFFLERGVPTVVSGVPPDAFSATGQRWGTPLYRWDVMRDGGFQWWSERLLAALGRADVVRLDHFIGFAHYWEIPAEHADARNGCWRPGPGLALFERFAEVLGHPSLPLLAEDLGCVSPEVDRLREAAALPGMRVLQFGLDDDDVASIHRAQNWPQHCVGYTGTHDNDTTRGWLERAPTQRRAALGLALGPDSHAQIVRALVHQALRSRAQTVIVPMQDLLALGGSARMNTPGRSEGNWTWQMRVSDLSPSLADELWRETLDAGRLDDAL